jgi:hypothetical protein
MAMANCHRNRPLAPRRFTVHREYNTAAYKTLPEAVKTIGGSSENPERFSQRNRICRKGLATIAAADEDVTMVVKRNRQFVRMRPYRENRSALFPGARCRFPAPPVTTRVVDKAITATPEVAVHETHSL